MGRQSAGNGGFAIFVLSLLHLFAFSLRRYLDASSVRFFTFASSLLVCAPRRKSQKETKRQSEEETSLICLFALSPLRLFALPAHCFFGPLFFLFFVASQPHFPAFCFLILPLYLFFLFPLLRFRAFLLPRISTFSTSSLFHFLAT